MVLSFFCNICAGVLEIQKNSELKVSPPGLIFFQTQGLIFGGAYIQKEISVSKSAFG